MGTSLWIYDNFLDLFLPSMKFYMLQFTNFIFNCIFTTKNLKSTCDMKAKGAVREKLLFSLLSVMLE